MNPFQEDENVIPNSSIFYKKYYNDNHKRHLILGINPGKFGAGQTGIPFTEKKIIALVHPRYIMQYKSKSKKEYIAKYFRAFNNEP